MKKFQKIQQKTKEPKEVNEKKIVAMDFSSKSQKLNAKKRVNRQISECKYRITALKQENLKIKRKNKALQKNLERSKSHVAPSPRNAPRLIDTQNSKTKHQIAAVGLKNVPSEIEKKLPLCNVLTTELSVAVDNNKKDLKSL